jgi:hypothetical protein
MTARIARILIALALGLTAGLVYGWLIRPVKYVDTAPGSLRVDYRTDYVLMVAQAYAADDNLELARVRLAGLGPQNPTDIVTTAIEYAVAHQFGRLDLDTLNHLAVDLRVAAPTAEIGSP